MARQGRSKARPVEKRTGWIVPVAVVAGVILWGQALFTNTGWLWGVNSLAFLPQSFDVLFVAMAGLSVVLLLLPSGLLEKAWLSEFADRFPADTGRIHWLVPAAIFALMSTLLLAKTHFLGDGYTWISNMGSGEAHYQKWTEYGGTYAVRTLQSILGGFTRETSRLSFQILSVVSGFVVVYNLAAVLFRLVDDFKARLLALVALIFSGASLLFFGYVEFYPMVWALVSIYLNFAVKYAVTGQGLLPAVVSLAIAPLFHIQAVILVPGLVWAVVSRSSRRLRKSRKARRLTCLGFCLLPVVGLISVWALREQLPFSRFFLRVFEGRPHCSDYAVFTIRHLNDIFQLALFVFPGLWFLAAIGLGTRQRHHLDTRSGFLIISSVSGLVFLFGIEPYIGMGRDWDLMSIAMLPLFLLLCYLTKNAVQALSASRLVSISAFIAVVGISIWACNTTATPAEARFLSLLRYYGKMDRNGWLIYAQYWREQGDEPKAMAVLQEAEQLFPEHRKLRQAYAILEGGDVNGAYRIATELLRYDPENADYLQLMANVLLERKQATQAEDMLQKALHHKPDQPSLLRDLARVYLLQGRIDLAIEKETMARRLDPRGPNILEVLGAAYVRGGRWREAAAMADSLLFIDSSNAGGYLLRTMVALQRGDTLSARASFRQYVFKGPGRPEYQDMLRTFGFLAE